MTKNTIRIMTAIQALMLSAYGIFAILLYRSMQTYDITSVSNSGSPVHICYMATVTMGLFLVIRGFVKGKGTEGYFRSYDFLTPVMVTGLCFLFSQANTVYTSTSGGSLSGFVGYLFKALLSGNDPVDAFVYGSLTIPKYIFVIVAGIAAAAFTLLRGSDADAFDSSLTIDKSKLAGLINRKTIIAIAVVAVLAVAVFFYNEYMSGNRYSLQDYLYDVQFSGTNGDGVVLVPGVNYNAMDSLGFENAYNLSDVMDTVSYSAEPCNGLSNGDKVTIKATYDEDMGKSRGIKLTDLEWTVEVQGLEDEYSSYSNDFGQNYLYTDPVDDDFIYEVDSSDESGYDVGSTYTVQDVLRVRENPDINARQLKRNELSDGDFENSVDYPDALLQKGSLVKCLEMSDNWMRIESGWICVNDGEEVLVK